MEQSSTENLDFNATNNLRYIFSSAPFKTCLVRPVSRSSYTRASTKLLKTRYRNVQMHTCTHTCIMHVDT